MIKYSLDNNIRLIYEHRKSNLTSFCIGFNAGALEEKGFNLGSAHAVEHMLYKGTTRRSEEDINNLSDEIFGFSNAMTNYPYAIYYGTLDSTDFNKGFDLLSDIVMNPIFPEKGFREEMSVIEEELKDWKEDQMQHCEDLLFYNAFKSRRIRELIIGNKESINRITLEEIKSFYNKYYCPENCVISVVSSLSFDEVLEIVNKYMANWDKKFCRLSETEYENNDPGVFKSKEGNSEGARIQYCFTLHHLTESEMSIINGFNIIFGDGVSSMLYDLIRTKKGLAYEVHSRIKNERGIKVLAINVSTSKQKVCDAIRLIDECISESKIRNYEPVLLKKAFKRYKLKEEFLMERSVELCKRLTTYELMFGETHQFYEELELDEIFQGEKVREVINKVFNNPTIQILE